MRLTRSNDDPRLLADLERLAHREPAPESEATATGPAAAVAAIDDSFVRRFVQGAIHLRRYAPFYAGGGLWLLTLLLIQPVGSGDDGRRAAFAQPTGLGRAGTAAPSAAPSVDDTASPVFDALGGSTFAGATFDDRDTGASFGGGESAFDTPPTTFPESSSFDDSEFETFEDEDDPAGPTPLAIAANGYASSTGGTPLEKQPAGGGLPVTVAGGTTTKFSFFRVTGTDTLLRLKETSESVGHQTAAVRACPLVSADWKAGPGQPMSAAPKVDGSALCATGTRDGEGIWTFDLSDFTPVADGNGFAIIPGSGTASTFQVVFEPVAVPPAPPAED